MTLYTRTRHTCQLQAFFVVSSSLDCFVLPCRLLFHLFKQTIADRLADGAGAGAEPATGTIMQFPERCHGVKVSQFMKKQQTNALFQHRTKRRLRFPLNVQ